MASGISVTSTIAAGFAKRNELNKTRKLLGLGARGVETTAPQQAPPPQPSAAGPTPSPEVEVPANIPRDEEGNPTPQTRGQMRDFVQSTLNRVTMLKQNQANLSGLIAPKRGTRDWKIEEMRRFHRNIVPQKAEISGNRR